MKAPLFSPSRHIILFLIIISSTVISFAQQTLTTVSRWKKNAYVHLPDDYNKTGSQTYPIIIFFPGIGEAEGSASKLLSYGPSKFIADGNKMEFNVNGVIEKPIVISVQPGAWPTSDAVDDIITDILDSYRVDENRVYLTGLSMGGGSIDTYSITSSTYAKKITAIVAMHAAQAPADLMGKVYAGNGGKWWGIEGKDDWRGMESIALEMNLNVPGSAVYTLISSGAGTTHCCWNTFYDPKWTKDGESIYTWMLKQNRSSSLVGSIVSGVTDIVSGALGALLPVNLVSFTASVQDSRAKLAWQTASEINNSHFLIEKSTNGNDFTRAGTVRGKGTYNYVSDYSFVDEATVEGTSYYRLKQYDFNGNVKDYGTRAVTVKNSAHTLKVYPTHLTQNTFTLYAGTASNIGQTFQLIDMSGRILVTGKITQLTQTVEVPSLQRGMFLLQLSNGRSIKLIKD